MSETLSTDSERCSPEHTFYCGVVEGFYGKPWSFSQRKELFRRMKRWSMNTYVYAPKDDSKHRLHWRETYTQEELSHLRCLIQQAYENDILFVYAISPGLDMHYSKLEEIELLKRKIKQVTDVGCQALAFLFDDIEAELCSEDKEKFASPAHAHVFVTNELYECFGHPTCFFCPTEYCTTRAVPSLSQSEYLATVGKGLLPGIDILWTGPKVISNEISVEHVEEVGQVLRRPPLLWDNLHANDYDRRRLFLGPYHGRPTDIASKVRGVLSNPNCEFEANFVPLFTLSQWRLLADAYDPMEAIPRAAREWMFEFRRNERSDSVEDLVESKAESPVDVMEVTGPDGRGVQTGEARMDLDKDEMKLDDVELLIDLFHLPYGHGPKATAMLRQFDWLRSNAFCLQTKNEQRSNEWLQKAEDFRSMESIVSNLFRHLCSSANRSLVYDLYAHVSDLRSTIVLLRAFVDWLALGHQDDSPGCERKAGKQPFCSGDQEPWIYRGGLLGEMQRLLPIMSAPGAPFARPIAVPVFTIRPYMQSDHDVLREFCEKHFLSHALVDGEALISFPSLAIDSSIGDYIALSSDLIFVLDTTGQLCGYACGALNAQQHRTGAQSTWKPQMAVKYPAGLLDSELHPSIKILIEAFHSDRGRGPLLPEDIYEQYPSIVTMAMTQESLNLAYLPFSLLSALTNCLRGQGSHGVHTVLSAENRVLHECFTSQGFTELMRTADGAVILGRSIERFP